MIKLYVVQRVSDGLYYRSQRYKKWVEFKDCNIYGKPGPAKAAATTWTNIGTEVQLIEMEVSDVKVIDLEAENKKKAEAKRRKLEAAERRRIEEAKKYYEKIKRDAEAKLAQL